MKNALLKTISITALMGLALGACSSSNVPQTFKPHYALPKNEVEQSSTSHTINFGIGGALSDAEKRSLESFIYNQGVQYGDELVLDFAKNDPGWNFKLTAVSDFLKSRGIWVKYASQSGSVGSANQAVLNVNKYSVISPDCDGLASSTFTRGELDDNPSFGCVTAYNLGLMVANPQDLIEGQPDTLPGTFRSVRALQLYRSRTGLTHMAGGLPVDQVITSEYADEAK